ncbi:hypothetical protein HNQ59_002843 [Chitinivorax tropicus]|uniref:DUF2946 family protein n=1 Tax=Chitinivorax tropicus TaxID=714531 RepID=A0A840MWJ2_9PROT|nr:DUF2946 family protein [Chitinivorax tropicus]MBB5019541.1 hypothetical protein [Chitinivorax tropicus]
MDDIVVQAMAKWPNVPAVYGWLRLDHRGQWWVRQERVNHVALVDFIGRNYACSPNGDYYFQNGPQQVYVALDIAPWVVRLLDDSQCNDWRTHTGQVVKAGSVVLDEEGSVYLDTPLGLALVDERDLLAVSTWLCTSQHTVVGEARLLAWLASQGESDRLFMRLGGEMLSVDYLSRQALPSRYRFRRNPQPSE